MQYEDMKYWHNEKANSFLMQPRAPKQDGFVELTEDQAKEMLKHDHGEGDPKHPPVELFKPKGASLPLKKSQREQSR